MDNDFEHQQYLKEWWQKRKIFYNLLLFTVGIVSFCAYGIVGGKYIPVPEFEITLGTMLFHGIIYTLYMLGGNYMYSMLSYITDDWNKVLSKTIFYIYLTMSCALPFAVPLMLYLSYKDGYPMELIEP